MRAARCFGTAGGSALWMALALFPAPAPAADVTVNYAGRPIYSEPGTGLQMPPGCELEPTWRSRIASSDHEVWVVTCAGVAHSWILHRTLVEMVGGSQARLRFQVTDDRAWPGETAGDSLSVQCTGRDGADTGYVVIGARWRSSGNTLKLASARAVIRGDPASQRFVAANVGQVECTRHPEREAMLRRLQKVPR